jgi:hypothetical protein
MAPCPGWDRDDGPLSRLRPPPRHPARIRTAASPRKSHTQVTMSVGDGLGTAATAGPVLRAGDPGRGSPCPTSAQPDAYASSRSMAAPRKLREASAYRSHPTASRSGARGRADPAGDHADLAGRFASVMLLHGQAQSLQHRRPGHLLRFAGGSHLADRGDRAPARASKPSGVRSAIWSSNPEIPQRESRDGVERHPGIPLCYAGS